MSETDNFKFARNWIQSQHLGQDQISSYKETFESSTFKLLQIDNFLLPSIMEEMHVYLNNEAIYEDVHKLRSPSRNVTREEWNLAKPEDHFLSFSREKGAKDEFKASKNCFRFNAFKIALRRAEIMDYFKQITGCTIKGLQKVIANRLTHESILKPHDDKLESRSLCCILYISPNWLPEYGGEFQFQHHPEHSSSDYKESFVPVCNRLVIFAPLTSHQHSVLPIHGNEQSNPRLNFSFWFHN